jgi:hypothetical protein
MAATLTDTFTGQRKKRTAEKWKATFDFAEDLATGETISSSDWAVTVVKGTDATPSGVLTGSPTISGSKVTHMLQGGLEGVTYCIRCAATTSQSQILHGLGHLEVSDAC